MGCSGSGAEWPVEQPHGNQVQSRASPELVSEVSFYLSKTLEHIIAPDLQAGALQDFLHRVCDLGECNAQSMQNTEHRMSAALKEQ